MKTPSRTIAQGLLCSVLLAGCNNGPQPNASTPAATQPPPPSSTSAPYASQPAPAPETPATQAPPAPGESAYQPPTPAPSAPARAPRTPVPAAPAPAPESAPPPVAEESPPAAPPQPQEAPVNAPPPPAEIQERVVIRPGYAWTPGYWRWDIGGRRYAWVRGTYVHERPGFVWVRAHWQRGPRGAWFFQQGYWQAAGALPPPQHGPFPPPHGPVPPPPGQGPGADAAFFHDALGFGAQDVEESRIASSRATNPDVMRFAQHVVDAQEAANRRLSDASHMPPGQVNNSGALQALRGLSGQEFDLRYLTDTIAVHQNAITLYERVSRTAIRPETRALAAEILPNLRAQMSTALQLRYKLQRNHLYGPNPNKTH